MSDPVTNAEVEDVLSSIRRLVSEDKRPAQAAKPQTANDRLVLTPALRVADPAPEPSDPAAAPSEAADPAGAPAPQDSAQADVPQADEFRPHFRHLPRADAAPRTPEAEEASPAPAKVREAELSMREARVRRSLLEAAAGRATSAPDAQQKHTPPAGTSAPAEEAKASEPRFSHRSGADVSPLRARPAPQDAPSDTPANAADLRIDPTTGGQAAAEERATLSAKIAALETAIGKIPDTWEPDEPGTDAYSGTPAPTMTWEDDIVRDATGALLDEEAESDADAPAAEAPGMFRHQDAGEPDLGMLDDDVLAADEFAFKRMQLSDPAQTLEPAELPEDAAEADEAPIQDAAPYDAPEPAAEAEPLNEPVQEAAEMPEAAAMAEAEDFDANDFDDADYADHPSYADSEDAQEADLSSVQEQLLDEEALRDLVTEIVRSELQGALGERITRNVRKLVRREIHRALAAQELE